MICHHPTVFNLESGHSGLGFYTTSRDAAHYGQAMDDFLIGFNNCRAIIASRHFRGPKHLGWPLFRILPLESRRWELIRKAELDPAIERELSQNIAIAPSEIQEMAKNPMFLGLLCEEMRAGSLFPATTHSVFEHYLQTRLTRDADRLQKRFQLAPVAVRAAAERIAFCMTSDAGLGLNPTRPAGCRAPPAAPTPCPSWRQSVLSNSALNFTLLLWTRQPRRQYKIVSDRNFRIEPLLHERGTSSEKALNESAVSAALVRRSTTAVSDQGLRLDP